MTETGRDQPPVNDTPTDVAGGSDYNVYAARSGNLGPCYIPNPER